jgi:hypothetical protein
MHRLECAILVWSAHISMRTAYVVFITTHKDANTDLVCL